MAPWERLKFILVTHLLYSPEKTQKTRNITNSRAGETRLLYYIHNFGPGVERRNGQQRLRQPPPVQPVPQLLTYRALPYMHPHHYNRYDQRMPPTSSANFEKRPLRSPNEILQESVRASVLRDGSKAAGRPGSPGPLSLAYRASSSNLPGQPEADAPPENRFDPDQATALICPESNNSERCQDPGCPEDLRMKMEPGGGVQQDEPPSSTGGGNGNGGGGSGGGGSNVLNSTTAPNGSIGPQTKYNHDRDKDLIPASLWSTVAGKLSHKTGTVNTPDENIPPDSDKRERKKNIKNRVNKEETAVW
ncbi:hypothetical protein NQ317_012953 [Molorchus minor]|uniref:Uncharacterized protein n=1 Tax=Molorchus minor TaxID=1323400 RepID=A0ABQ9JMV0_9CUCU|nr:hypothetical protein NQ317_012953 [Molorchus minor]